MGFKIYNDIFYLFILPHLWHAEVPEARDQTCATAATQATVVTVPNLLSYQRTLNSHFNLFSYRYLKRDSINFSYNPEFLLPLRVVPISERHI